MSSGSWEDAGLVGDPFSVVPPTEPTSRWVGRPQLRIRIERLVAGWRISPGSSIELMWADFGAGKTHALRYLEHLVLNTDPPGVPIYADLSAAPQGFFDIYLRVLPRIPEGVLLDGIFAFQRKAKDWLAQPVLRGDTETAKALWMLHEFRHAIQGDLVRTWLRGGPLSRVQLEAIGSPRPIKNSQDALRVLQTIFVILAECQKFQRIVLMLDEFQRVGQVSQKRIHDINAGLKALYDAVPQRFTLFLTYSFGVPENIRFMTSDDLRNRVNSTLSLPELTKSEGEEFLRELLEGTAVSPGQLPLTPKGIERVVTKVSETRNAHRTPRRLMQGCKSVVLSAILDGRIFPLGPEDVDDLFELPEE